jgi:large subunit ribosomal protein L29
MKAAELRETTVEELRKKEQDLRKELFNLRFQQATGEIENPMRIRAIKKNIAKILTVITEKNKQKAS